MQVTTILEELKSLGTEDRILFSHRNFPSSMEFYGVTMPDLRLAYKALRNELKLLSENQKLALAQELVASKNFEGQIFVYVWLDSDKKWNKSLKEEEIISLSGCQDNWVSVDYFGSIVTGPALREERIEISTLGSWINHENVWYRRLALTSAIGYMRGIKYFKISPSEFVLPICKTLVDDHHKMIYQAVSWVLRSLVKFDRNEVDYFLEANSNKLHPRIIREVNTKLETGLKNG
ncbi:DNA alkylation repair protein [Luteibaculum oceani]|uniref:DNA alkylation repair protein n=1 Tax=Luteibaculum oceani TaxID=1294296 RepID=A0A5C6VAJ5_9FLAO|nr:DNA alkylation repair protein [Luteibaculum oceani]TXC81326.1 DNA alkylation repair protein [Luteibaculum oceani]